MAKIVIQNRKHFLSVVEKARELGIYSKLSDKLHYFQEFGRGKHDKETQVILGYDFADMSFGFCLVNPGEDRPCIVGGLIFHPGCSGPDQSFSVELCPQSEPHWSVHT